MEAQKNLEWFKEHKGNRVVCILPNKEEKPVLITSDRDAIHYHGMQDRGYQFEELVLQ